MPSEPAVSKARQLRALLDTSRLDFIMEAHDGLSARIVEEAGFPAIWASGLAISASLGVRDNNEASWTQVLEVAEFMADASRIPVLLDGDTGFGNFNNFRRAVHKMEQRGIAGVCIEDKVFPKTNSFLRGEKQPLALTDEFCGKIKAGKEAQEDPDFVIIARTEALIAGWGLDEALRRAEAYRLAGADAIVVHSAQSRSDEVLAFLDAWDNRLPVVLIPTKYHRTPTDVFAKRRVAALIWGNHLLRASISAMQFAAARIRRDGSVTGVEENIAPLSEVFRLQGDAELQAAEERFLAAAPASSAIILAATRGGQALHALTERLPKTLLRVGGMSLLDRLCANLSALQVRDITVVGGYRREAITRPGIRLVANEAWETTGELASLGAAAEALNGPCLILFGDILCRRHLLQALLDAEGDFVIAADRQVRRDATDPERKRDLVKLASPAPQAFLDGTAQLSAAAFSNDFARFDAEWIGAMKCSARGARLIREWLATARPEGGVERLAIIDLLSALAASGEKIEVHLVSGDWTSIESTVDLADASNL